MNIDQTEIQKFESLADDWWDKKGPFKPLHEMNPLRLSFIQQHVSLAGKKVLDVGCGGGILAESCAKVGARVIAIDASVGAIEAAKRHLVKSQLNIDYQVSMVEALGEKHQGQFDVITCMELLEHVPSPIAMVKQLANLLCGGGHLFFSTINRNVKSFCFAILGAEYILRLLPRGTHCYAQFIRPSELTEWCLKARLEPQGTMGISYNPIFRRYALSESCSVNYLFYAKFLGAEGRNRTDTMFPSPNFESGASTSSATPASRGAILTRLDHVNKEE